LGPGGFHCNLQSVFLTFGGSQSWDGVNPSTPNKSSLVTSLTTKNTGQWQFQSHDDIAKKCLIVQFSLFRYICRQLHWPSRSRTVCPVRSKQSAVKCAEHTRDHFVARKSSRCIACSHALASEGFDSGNLQHNVDHCETDSCQHTKTDKFSHKI